MPENPYGEYLVIKTAAATGYTREQVRTLNRLERETQLGYENECRRAQRGDPFTPCVESFEVTHDERLDLPRVTFYDIEADWMRSEVVVHKDGSLDYRA